MVADVARALARFHDLIEPRDGLGSNPFKLACTFEAPATSAEIAAALSGRLHGGDVEALWSTSRATRLFEDVEYGQWGLVLLSPSDSADRTARFALERPEVFRDGDVVLGEFLGDLELLVLTEDSEVLVALPLDGRDDWYRAASTLADFLERYRDALGDKFWEQSG